ITECLRLGRRAVAAGLQFCPHWLGSSVGLMASLNLLGAAGGKGWGEWDANPNPLRERLMPADITVTEGVVTLSDAPGIGFAPDMAVLKEFAARSQPGPRPFLRALRPGLDFAAHPAARPGSLIGLNA